MTPEPASNQAAFDEFAGDYDSALARGISVSGEDKMYFARGRVADRDDKIKLHITEFIPRFAARLACID